MVVEPTGRARGVVSAMGQKYRGGRPGPRGWSRVQGPLCRRRGGRRRGWLRRVGRRGGRRLDSRKAATPVVSAARINTTAQMTVPTAATTRAYASAEDTASPTGPGTGYAMLRRRSGPWEPASAFVDDARGARIRLKSGASLSSLR